MIRPIGSADAGEKMCMLLNNIFVSMKKDYLKWDI